MKRFILILTCLASSTLFSAQQVPPTTYLRKGCDLIYTRDINNILTQFQNLATPAQRSDYKTFMLQIKLYSDLEFKVVAFEKLMTADIRSRLRKPLTNYSACRSFLTTNAGMGFQTPGPSKSFLRPCEGTYAVEIQDVLNTFRGLVSPETLKQYEDYMIILKYYDDIGFEIQEFEKRTNNVTTARLRMPLVQYNTCRDSIILINYAEGGGVITR